jgi:hypothetical protein
MNTTNRIFEGTWEQINRQAEQLAGKWLRVEVIPRGPEVEDLPLACDATPSSEARAQAILDWGYGHARRSAPPLSDEAISRESIYSDERD